MWFTTNKEDEECKTWYCWAKKIVHEDLPRLLNWIPKRDRIMEFLGIPGPQQWLRMIRRFAIIYKQMLCDFLILTITVSLTYIIGMLIRKHISLQAFLRRRMQNHRTTQTASRHPTVELPVITLNENDVTSERRSSQWSSQRSSQRSSQSSSSYYRSSASGPSDESSEMKNRSKSSSTQQTKGRSLKTAVENRGSSFDRSSSFGLSDQSAWTQLREKGSTQPGKSVSFQPGSIQPAKSGSIQPAKSGSFQPAKSDSIKNAKGRSV